MENMAMKALLERRSCRKFKPDAVPDGLLDQISAAGLNAASGRNRQPAIIIQIRNKAIRDTLSKLNADIMGVDSDPFYGAPTVLVVCYDQNEVWHNPFDPTIDSGEIDASIVADEMVLAAWDEGIASCWVAHFNPKKINSGLKIQEHIRPVVLIPIGYAEDGVEPALRHTESKDLDEIVHEL